ncbi:MAG: hypothetical protein ISQ08_02875 [Planctomycetes bacterium]|nr:hypothetical protein [Planctomycetota bacterium]MDA0946968.1 hypothetical protein [Planctomycetota bacterium]
MRLLLALGLTAGLLQSAYGFLATFEPGIDPLPWRLIYAGAALGCGIGLGRLARSRHGQGA